MEQNKHKITLYQPATYQITVPGHLDKGWMDWGEGITITNANDADGYPVTILTGCFDQAALQGLLRRLYSLGLPLISIVCVATGG